MNQWSKRLSGGAVVEDFGVSDWNRSKHKLDYYIGIRETDAKGLGAYDTLIAFVSEKWTEKAAWQLEYYLGTYAALKWYGWKFFLKHDEPVCAKLYESVYKAWQAAFDLKRKKGVKDESIRMEIVELLKEAKAAEVYVAAALLE